MSNETPIGLAGPSAMPESWQAPLTGDHYD